MLYFGEKITYRKLFAEIDKTAKALAAYGIKSGDNVCLCMPAVPEAIYAILTLNRMGANAIMLNPTFTPEQLTDRINGTEAKLLLVANEMHRVVKNLVPNTCKKTVISCPAVNSLGAVVKACKKVKKISGTTDWNDFIRSGKDAALPPIAAYQKDYPAIIVYSSGTTGASKGIQLTNNGIAVYDDVRGYFEDEELRSACAYTSKTEKARGGIEKREHWQLFGGWSVDTN